jgi:hypothetical protein
MALPEWGVTTTASGSNVNDSPGDDPTFVNNVFAWATTQASAGNTVYLWPWNNDGWAFSSFPQSVAALARDVSDGKTAGLVAP